MKSCGKFRLNTSCTSAAAVPKHTYNLRTPRTRRILYGDPDSMDANTSDAAGILKEKSQDTVDQIAQVSQSLRTSPAVSVYQ